MQIETETDRLTRWKICICVSKLRKHRVLRHHEPISEGKIFRTIKSTARVMGMQTPHDDRPPGRGVRKKRLDSNPSITFPRLFRWVKPLGGCFRRDAPSVPPCVAPQPHLPVCAEATTGSLTCPSNTDGRCSLSRRLSSPLWFTYFNF